MDSFGVKGYKEWTRVAWDGNPDLNYEAWVKGFGRGNIYVGIGDFHLVCIAMGPNSPNSMSAGRWNYGEIVSEADMMAHIDATYGKDGRKWVPYPVKPGQREAWLAEVH